MDLKNTVQTIADFIPQYCRRNKVILQDKTRKTERKKVNVHYWRKNKRGGQEDNLGDYLSLVLVEEMKQRLSIDDEKN